MRLILSILILLLCLSGCTDTYMSDKELKSNILGIWSASYDEGNFWLYGESLYRENGTILHIGKICISNKCRITTVEETYEISNGIVTAVVVSSDDEDYPVERVVTDKIKSINKETLIFVNNEGKEHFRKRVSEPVYIKELL